MHWRHAGRRLGSGQLDEQRHGGVGGYGIAGYTTSGIIGKIFTLYGSAPSAGNAVGPALPTKAPPKPAAPPGNALQVDLRGWLRYSGDQEGGFTDSTGFIWGTERFHTWDAGAQARLFATIPNGRLTWTPYVTASVDREFAYSDALAIPAQAGQIADTIYFGSPQTFWGTQVGLFAHDFGGVGVGIRGGYQQSAEFQIWSAQAYLIYAWPQTPGSH